MTKVSLKVAPCSYQDGKKRTQQTEGGPKRPEIAPWRNNLTALSQYRNLYFVAYVDKVYVFEPLFPDQIVPTEPVSVIDLPASRPELRGYIDYRRPQAANHVLVRDLGNEEILLIACDSGDIIGYTTRSIEKAIQQQPSIDESHVLEFSSPFFHENVGASAWGLDVHKKARLIAVSCNTQEINIFAFALAENGVESSSNHRNRSEHGSQQDINEMLACNVMRAPLSPLWKCTYRDGWRYQRSQNNFAFPLRGHTANIPNISFLNPSGDEDACPYLTSTDINGATRLWNVWKRDMRPLVLPDRRYACLASSRLETYGCEPSFVESQSRLCDNSDCGKAIPDNSRWHPAFSKFSTVPGVDNGVDAPADLNPEQEDTDEASEGPSSEGIDQEIDDGLSDGSMDTEDYNHAVMSGSSNVASASDGNNARLQHTKHREVEQPTCQNIDYEFCKQLPCNILMATEDDLLFIDHGFSSVTTTPGSSYYALACKKPVHQIIPPGVPVILKHIERLNMVHHISELGVVAVGNQAGRVALLIMTYWPEVHRYGFRLEAILPFKSQEEKGMRPEAPLLGMAISPVQGQGLSAYSPSNGTPETNAQSARGTSGRY
ncbi:MAG: hypothetical protein Q9217_006860, partial [Psora testacea]